MRADHPADAALADGGARDADSGFVRRAGMAVGVGAGVVVALLLLWRARDVLLLALAGVLLALLLRALSEELSRRTRLSDRPALAVVVLALAGLLSLAVWLRAPAVAEQVDVLREILPRAVGELTQRLERYGWGRALVAELRPTIARVAQPSTMLDHASSLAPSMLEALARAFIVLFTAIYVAVEPRWYARGIVRLVPLRHRERARSVLRQLGHTLRRWLLARLTSMAIVGVLTGVGLWLLDMPLVLTLALLAALLDFVPNFGPVLAAVPAVLLAVTHDPLRALHVALLYLAVQLLEAYAITPFLQRRAVSLPPALVLSVQAVLGILVGALGLALAAPVTVVALVLVRTLYVESLLGDDADRDDPAEGTVPESDAVRETAAD